MSCIAWQWCRGFLTWASRPTHPPMATPNKWRQSQCHVATVTPARVFQNRALAKLNDLVKTLWWPKVIALTFVLFLSVLWRWYSQARSLPGLSINITPSWQIKVSWACVFNRYRILIVVEVINSFGSMIPFLVSVILFRSCFSLHWL